jgi:phosphatidate cytidylyltransferase
MLRTRLISVAVLLPVVVAAVIVGGWLWAALAGAAALLAAHEYLHLVGGGAGRPRDHDRARYALGMAIAALFLADALWPALGIGSWGLALAVLAPLAALVLRGNPEGGLSDWAFIVSGMLYVGYTLAHWLRLRGLEHGMEWTVVALAGTWMSDTGAYFVGRAWGRRPFFPSISPRKTLEGALGGLVVGTLAALAAAALLPAPAPLWKVFVLGIGIGVAAPLGDLAESVIKRQTGFKDAGRLIPGHGGMLDRLDSLIFVGPLTYYVVTLWMQAG